ncbi:amidohydrolase family protein [Rhodohalobacter mucosus]|uniref:Amidohydrolase n=1 Tax=Rhodohalobacter mucosus TaxID=2079485 RepID=A0A316TWJ5_9BACT|nr:amidohydrolase family protein [Rhodohalobacter mucosus]PWN07759.1 amidohydrolase [Rhodohalobacter mucosus]
MMIKRLLLLGLLLITAVQLVQAQQTPHVFEGAEIIPIEGDPIANGVLVVQDGKITAVGAAGSVSVPRNAVRHDMSGMVIMPGLVDTHSHIGEGDGGDGSSSMHPDVRIMDTIDPRSKTFIKAMAGGITTVNIMPGSGLLMSGQTVYVKTKPSNTIEEMLVVVDEETGIYGGLKMANGTNPLRSSGSPGTRAKSAALVRGLFVKAQDYQNKIREADGDPEKMPARDLQMETLVEVLEGKRIVHHHTHRHDDILTAIRLSEEFGYRVVLQHVSEAWRVADEIAGSSVVGSSIIQIDSPGGKLEAINLLNINGKALEDAGAPVAYHTDDPIVDSRFFLRSAALGVNEGMSRQKALEAVTIAGARLLDLDHRVGSLEPGKDADFIILNGDPFSVYTHIEQTWIEGEKAWDRSNPDDKVYATGGYDIFRHNATHVHDIHE